MSPRRWWLALLAAAGCGDLLGFRDPALRPPDQPVSCEDGWLYRVPISLENAAGRNLAEYQIPVVLDTWSLIDAGKLRPDGGDLRFSDGTRTLPYHIERWLGTTATGIWVRVSLIPRGQSTIWAVYGNPLAEPESSAAATFEPGIVANPSFEQSDDQALSWTRVQTSPRATRAGALWPETGWVTDGTGSLHIFIEQDEPSTATLKRIAVEQAAELPPGSEHVVRFDLRVTAASLGDGGGSFSFRGEGDDEILWSLGGTAGSGNITGGYYGLETRPLPPGPIKLRFWASFTRTTGFAVGDLDNVRVRKHVDPEPVVVIFAEEPTCP